MGVFIQSGLFSKTFTEIELLAFPMCIPLRDRCAVCAVF